MKKTPFFLVATLIVLSGGTAGESASRTRSWGRCWPDCPSPGSRRCTASRFRSTRRTMEYWSERHTGVLRVERVGESVEKMPIFLLKITDSTVPDEDKQVCLVTALHGGPERSGTTTVSASGGMAPRRQRRGRRNPPQAGPASDAHRESLRLLRERSIRHVFRHESLWRGRRELGSGEPLLQGAGKGAGNPGGLLRDGPLPSGSPCRCPWHRPSGVSGGQAGGPACPIVGRPCSSPPDPHIPTSCSAPGTPGSAMP